MIKFINFISHPTYIHHKKVLYWQRIACGTTSTLLASLCMISAIQMEHLQGIKKQVSQKKPLQIKAEDMQQQHHALNKKKEALLKKIEDWEKYTHHAKKPSDMLSAVQQSVDEKNIRSLHIAEQKVSFQMHVQSTEDGMQVTQNLSQTTIFNSVRVTSLKKEEDGINAEVVCCAKKA